MTKLSLLSRQRGNTATFTPRQHQTSITRRFSVLSAETATTISNLFLLVAPILLDAQIHNLHNCLTPTEAAMQKVTTTQVAAAIRTQAIAHIARMNGVPPEVIVGCLAAGNKRHTDALDACVAAGIERAFQMAESGAIQLISEYTPGEHA